MPTERLAENACRVVVAYEHNSARDNIMSACQLLVDHSWVKREFQFTWWKFSHLRDAGTAELAAAAANEARLIIFSTDAGGDLPEPVRKWTEGWMQSRPRGGAIAALFGAGQALSALPACKHQYLTGVARRAGMDYLSQFLPSQPESIETMLEIILQRPDSLAHIVKEILDHDPCMRRWGIND